MVKSGQLDSWFHLQGLKQEVIRVPKIYDWINDSIVVKKEVFFGEEQIKVIEHTIEDPKRRPLRLIAKVPNKPTDLSNQKGIETEKRFLCEQLGEKQVVSVRIGGQTIPAEKIDLLLNCEIDIEIQDRSGQLVTEACVEISTVESFVLVYPEGTQLSCQLQNIEADITSHTIFLQSNFPKSFNLDVIFGINLHVEAQVLLEVLGKFASPRRNDLEIFESDNHLDPVIPFPVESPQIFPFNKPSYCQVQGDASSYTNNSNHEEIRMRVSLNTEEQIEDHDFEFSFENNAEEERPPLLFTATQIFKESIKCEIYGQGLKVVLSGEGFTSDGKLLIFRLALVDGPTGDQFQVQLLDPTSKREQFNSGCLDVRQGKITITRVE